MNKRKIIEDVLKNYGDEDLNEDYSDFKILSLYEVETLVSRALDMSRQQQSNNLIFLFEEYSNNGYSKESVRILKEFCSKLEKL